MRPRTAETSWSPGLMVDALDQVEDSGSRQAALVHFVERVGAGEAAALRRALAELESKAATIADVTSGDIIVGRW